MKRIRRTARRTATFPDLTGAGYFIGGWLAKKIPDTLASKGANFIRRFWRKINPYTKWNVNITTAFLITGLTVVGLAALPSLVFTFVLWMPFSWNIPEQTNPNSIFFTWVLAGLSVATLSRSVYRRLEGVMDLDYPVFSCPVEGSSRTFTGLQLKRADQPFKCPHCGGTLVRRNPEHGWRSIGCTMYGYSGNR